jgi:ATP-dependent exoDNAse (exonuclease V) alpha subunit
MTNGMYGRAGKTTALKEYDAGVRAAERRHIILAPTAKAVEVLRRELGGNETEVMTVQRFLALQTHPGSNRKLLYSSVITVDEWGLLSNKMGHSLLKLAIENQADVRFIGDTRQHGSVEAGDFGRMLERHSQLRSAGLSKIKRQRDPEYNQAVRDLSAGYVASGLSRLDAKGWIHQHGPDYVHVAAECFLERSEQGRRLTNDSDSPHLIAVAPSHAEINAFTAELREKLQGLGVLTGEAVDTQAFLPFDRTTAQRRAVASYRPGDAVIMNGSVFPDVFLGHRRCTEHRKRLVWADDRSDLDRPRPLAASMNCHP